MPGVPPDRRQGGVGHVDVMPTLLELAGLEPDPEARGIALGPYLRSGDPIPERTLICDMGSELAAYRGDGFVRLVEVTPALLDPEAVPEQGDEDEPARPSWGRPSRRSLGPRWWSYQWKGGGSAYALERDPAATLPDEVRDYLGGGSVPPAFIDHIRPEDLERLRALGYW